jgi:NitT/TauT family transport system ATP-binding protein
MSDASIELGPQSSTSAVVRAARAGAIRVDGVSVELGRGAKRVRALSDVTLHVAPGEFVSIVGPSGCGKSTLLNLVAGFVGATAGEVSLDAQVVRGPGPERGVVFQQYALFPWLTVRDNVAYGLRARRVPKAQRERVVDSLLARCGLSAFAKHYPEQLSGGMRQRVAIVRAIANEPHVLLLDEPFGALDAQTREVMQEILLDLWQRFRTSVLFVTHDVEEAVFLSDRVYVMTARPGRIKAEVAIALPRDQRAGAVAAADGVKLVRELKALVREESARALGAAQV